MNTDSPEKVRAGSPVSPNAMFMDPAFRRNDARLEMAYWAMTMAVRRAVTVRDVS